jgi:hypothetical protein
VVGQPVQPSGNFSLRSIALTIRALEPRKRLIVIAAGHPALGVTDVRAAVVPTVPFKPAVHLNYAETVLPVSDGLPKLKDFPAAAGGSGELVPEQIP